MANHTLPARPEEPGADGLWGGGVSNDGAEQPRPCRNLDVGARACPALHPLSPTPAPNPDTAPRRVPPLRFCPPRDVGCCGRHPGVMLSEATSQRCPTYLREGIRRG